MGESTSFHTEDDFTESEDDDEDEEYVKRHEPRTRDDE